MRLIPHLLTYMVQCKLVQIIIAKGLEKKDVIITQSVRHESHSLVDIGCNSICWLAIMAVR